MISKKLIDLGVLALRQRNSRGTFKPHISLRFRDNAGDLRTFSIDTTRIPGKQLQPDAYLITHAHSDHHGKSAMLSPNSICSEKTAIALEIRHDRKYAGSMCKLGDEIDIEGTKVKTFSTEHTAGATAFYWENDVGTRILVTGDVKNASNLPPCDVLITEANYGDPADPSCHFADDLEGMKSALFENGPVAFGAYEFGKAQRAVELIRGFGYDGNICMDARTRALTRSMLEDAGELTGLDSEEDDGVFIVAPWDLDKLPWNMKKYVLSCRMDYPYPTIRISDHLDACGLENMVRKLSPEVTLVYHPGGNRPSKFSKHLNSIGIDSISIDQIGNVLSNEFI
ncbi:MBL fold metallo-hydrolase [Methanosarcina sp. UBA289]|uniref:MBL fold metallo-hydrolase n=1 Tax=Methanosarcina sp. UBA289 TaxID=1915574 RepID=UPI0025DD40FE|nr:MBL fold metallo-hydrolase [Methanosarcina sp. UBA289]